MRASLALALGGALTLVAAGCAGSYHVRTITAPDAALATLHTFRVLPAPPSRDGQPRAAGAYDPMVNNSIAGRALRQTIAQALQGRGYVATTARADFVVAVYASAHEKLDVTRWDYGYPYWPRWGWGPAVRGVDRVTTYAEGTVVIDVLRPDARDLLWRGAASATLSEDPARDVRALQAAADAIVQQFPRATSARIATRR